MNEFLEGLRLISKYLRITDIYSTLEISHYTWNILVRFVGVDAGFYVCLLKLYVLYGRSVKTF